MVSEKRIEAAAILHEIAGRQPEITLEDGASVVTESVAIQAMLEFANLTAAEQAEAAPAARSFEPEFETAPDNGTPAEVLAYVLDCARRWDVRARIIGNARAGDIERALSACLNFAPAARLGAVKEIVEEVCEGWCKESGGRGSFSDCFGCRIHRDLAALEPAEPAADTEPFGYWVKHKYADGGLLRPPAFIPETNHYTEVIPLYTHPSTSEARLREALEKEFDPRTAYMVNGSDIINVVLAALKEDSE